MDVVIIYDCNIQYSFWLQVGAKVKCPDSFGISDLRRNTCQIWRTLFFQISKWGPIFIGFCTPLCDFKLWKNRFLALQPGVFVASDFFSGTWSAGEACVAPMVGLRTQLTAYGVAEAGHGEVPGNQVAHTSRCPNCIVGWLQVSTWFFGSATPWFSNDVDPWSILYILVVGFSEFHFWRRPCPSASKTAKCWKEKLVDCLPKDRVSDIVVLSSYGLFSWGSLTEDGEFWFSPAWFCNSNSSLHTIKISRCAPCSSGKKSTFYRSWIEIISVHALVFSAILAPLQWRTPR